MAKLRFRHLMERVPYLDGLRLSFLAGFCQHGSTWMDHSYPITKIIHENARPYLEGEKPALFAIYHGRMVGMLQVVQKREQISILISTSRDGEIISRALLRMGFSVNRGSSQRGAVQGGMQVVKSAQSGHHQALMVDGPRGPIYEVKPGIVKLAAMTGLPIIPFVCQAKYFCPMWGWDKFMAPDWGTPLVYFYGDPIYVDKDANEDVLEATRQKLDGAMTRMRLAGEQYFQVVPV